MYDFGKAREEWARPPIGGENTATTALQAMSDEAICMWVAQRWSRQYSQPSNWQNRYVDYLGLDTTRGKIVMDFGCGFGFDALRYAKHNCEVILADIRKDTLYAAERILEAHGFMALEWLLATDQRPFFDDPSKPVDVIHCSGVLHHIPYAGDMLRRFAEVLAPNGEIRLMLYTDHLWRQFTRSDPGSIDGDVARHPLFDQFVRGCDAVGFYADWYTPEKLLLRCADLFQLTSWRYLRPDHGNAVAVLQKPIRGEP